MIETKWEKLQNKLEDSRSTLSHYHDLMSLFADMNDSLADITQIQVRRHGVVWYWEDTACGGTLNPITMHDLIAQLSSRHHSCRSR